jgi:integrase
VPKTRKKKRDYAFFLEAANGKQNPTIDAVLRSIERFEVSTNRKPFRKFHVEQARSFRGRLVEEVGAKGRPLSAATIVSTLKHLRNFFLWLSREPGFRQAINANDANYFTPSDRDMQIATAKRERPVATLDEIKHVLALMPSATVIERRNRALMAFAIISGARDGALASFRLKHVDMSAQTVFHDAREVRTKAGKTFASTFFPVGSEPVAIFSDYIAMLKDELDFGPDDPLFPSTQMAQGADRGFVAEGLSRTSWSGGAPIRQIFRDAFERAGLPYFNPHSLRKTIALHGDSLNLTREEEKAYSQNFGHENVRTTRESYGTLSERRQAEIMRALAKPRSTNLPQGLNLDALEAFLISAKEVSTAGS